MPSVYSLDNAIKTFFVTHTAATREECDELATSLVGRSVGPVPIQGAFSYTVEGGPKRSQLVQFRIQSSPSAIDILNLAKTVHGKSIADTIYHETFGNLSLFYVYEIQKLPGLTYIEARCRHGIPTDVSLDVVCRQSNTVADLARYLLL
jgi:hypothetical protein